jgi:signal transduction histidine kinase/ligand-binding sensor domain-containing protein/DNA-binding response OmpR family regulator
MKKPGIFVFSLCVLIFACRPAFAQDYKFTHIDTRQGLSHNRVTAFLKDRMGFLWVGTASGLDRFDGYTVKAFRTDPADSTSISNDAIEKLFELPGGRMGIRAGGVLNIYDPSREIFQNDTSVLHRLYGVPSGALTDVVHDQQGVYWFLHATAGLICYPEATGKPMSIAPIDGDTTSVSASPVTAFAVGAGGDHWIIHTDGVLERLAHKEGRWVVDYRSRYLYRHNKGAALDYRLLADDRGDVWVYVSNDNQGVYFFHMDLGIVHHLHQGATVGRLNTNLVSGIVQVTPRQFWIATDHGGINVVDKHNFSVRYISHRDENEKSLAHNSLTTLYRDDTGIIWAGTYKKGVSYYHENIIRFPVYKHYASDPASLPFEDVNRFVEDRLGNLWIGTNGGGLIYFNRKENTFRTFKHDPADPHSLSSNIIVSLCIDHDGKLWVGTYYGGLNCYDGKNFRRFAHDPSDPNSLAGRSVWEVFEDSQRRLWVGMLDGGLDLIDRRTGTFTHYRSGTLNSVSSRYVSAIAEDREGNLWIGTDSGLDVLMRETSRFVHYAGGKDPGALRNGNIFDIREDSHGRLWVATQGGLSLFDQSTKTFRTFTEQEGLPHNTILTVVEDRAGGLWMSTPNGLSHFVLQADGSVQVRNYDEQDGLQANQFNENAAFKTSSGELIFGGANGFNLFKPESIGLNVTLPRVVLSDFQLFNQSIRAGHEMDGRVFLQRAITEADAVVLPANKNVFSLEFTALNFFHPEKNQYKYMLEGFNTGWLNASSNERRVTFTNLDPGDYVFRVKAANNDGYWNERGAQLKITILPPFWKTKTAFALYLLAIVLALIVTRKLIQQHEQMKYAIESERREALRLHELDMMKLRFFTNVSHEFRTPLSLILAPMEKMLKQSPDDEQRNQFQLIQRNARRLLNLVNQLLDFRKLEVQEIRFNPSEGDVIHFIRETVHSFSDLSDKKGIALSFQTSVNTLETVFDQDKLEKILFNLLSNAFKFTPEQGTVSVSVTRQKDGMLAIEVRDTGIGIAPDKQEKVFERFFQNELPRSMVNQGSGIGLSIVREFVRIHSGTISVESEPGRGSCFTVRLPVQEVVCQPAARPVLAEPEAVVEIQSEPELVESETPGHRSLLLLVEDNEDFRFYLKDNLKYEYRIIEARHGQEGWLQALKYLPDLIVSDVMMPEMNGIVLCRKIKMDARVSHIPVILLTARTAEEQKLEGLESGADDYVTKPFNFEILQSRMRNLILQRERFHQAFPKVDIQASPLKITSVDEKLIQQAIACVERHASDADFSVDMLSREVGISRAHFYKKIMALTGKSPLEFIRTIRLQQAAQLLEKSQMTVAEVAYRVGFNNPKYFTRYFKEVYRVLPSAYAAGKRG